MFDFDKYNLSKKLAPELFTEKSLLQQKIEQNFINERPLLNKNIAFTKNLFLNGSKPNKVSAKEEDLYEFNAGTSLTLSAGNKIIIASDTRHSSEYGINSRFMTKIFRIGSFYLTTAGFYADGFEIYNKLLYKVKLYETYYKMSLSSLAHLLHNVLYSRRFFPLYSYAWLSGFENDEATIYSFDCIGNYQKTNCRCDGSASAMIQPLLDSWISGKNFENYSGINFDDCIELVKKAFDAAAELDCKTKDFLEIYILDGETISHQIIPLRKD